MKKKDIDLFNKGRNIAEEISSAMLNIKTGSRENLDEWLSQNQYSKQVVEKFTQEEQFETICDLFPTEKKKHIDRLAKALEQKRKKRYLIKVVTTTAVAVAAAVAVLSFLLLDYSKEMAPQPNHYVAIENSESKAKPILITNHGEEIILVENTTLNDGGTVDGEGYLKYDKGVEDKREIAYNKLVIPDRLTFSVELSDGTKVYLNANSTFEYPTQFSGNTREVILTGEAFFNVAKDDKKPFIVKTAQTEIQVYGTKFNVNSYNKNSVQTSLISGSVGVRVEGQEEIRIVPGQILVMNPENGETALSSLNMNKYEAWLNGYFRCDNEEIEIILEHIARWYGVEFFFESSDSRKIRISASINRERSIDEVVELLSITSGVRIIKKGGIYHIIK